MDFTQGYVFFWWHTLSFLYSFLSHQKLRPYWRKVWKASWVSFFLMIREKKCLPIFIFPLRLLWSEEESPAPRPGRTLRLVIPSSSGHLWRSQVSSCSHTCASPCPALFTERSQLCSSLLPIFLWPGLLSLPEENVNGLHELMYRILSWGQEETFISRVIYLWLLLKQMNRKNYLN